MLKSILDTNNWPILFLIIGTVLITALVFSGIYWYFKKKDGCSENYASTIVILPLVLVVLISGGTLILNNTTSDGSQYERALTALLAGILVIRYRSKNMESLELTYIFFMVAYAFLMGLGYFYLGLIYFGVVILVVLGINFYLSKRKKNDEYIIKISVPEDMNFENAFDDVFKEYAKSYKLFKVKSADMGTTFVLSYSFIPKDNSLKSLLDEIRIRNGNMNLLLTKKLDTQMD